jgi:hypothetical protein
VGLTPAPKPTLPYNTGPSRNNMSSWGAISLIVRVRCLAARLEVWVEIFEL